MSVTTLPVLVLTFFCLILVAKGLGQENTRRCEFIGTGVNGTVTVTNSDNTTAGNDIVVLGGLFSIFGNSGINPRSIQRMEAVALAIQNINDNPYLIPGVTLAFEIRATRGQINLALEESLRYVSSRTLRIENSTVLGISGVLGAGFSSVSTAVARLLRLFRIPQISYASTADVLSDKSTYEYFLRTVPPDSLQAQALADIIEYFNWTYVIAMHTADVYGTGGITAFIDELGKRNSSRRCVATPFSIELPTNSTLTEEFDNAVDEMNREWISNATVVVLFATRNTAIGLLGAVKRRRETDPSFAAKNMTWIGSDAWGDNIPSELYDIVRGSLSVAPRTLSSKRFEEYFLSLTPLNHSANPWFAEYWELIFNCSIKVHPGLKQCNLTNQTLTVESTSLQSSVVTPAVDAVYAFAHAIHRMQLDVCGGGPKLCVDMLDNRSGGVAIQGEALLSYLRNVSFSPGASAEVIHFNENGDPKGTSYVVKNLQRNSSPPGMFTFKVVGVWDNSRSSPLEFHEVIQWSHNAGNVVPKSVCSLPCGDGEQQRSIAGQSECCWICTPCPGRRDVSKGHTCQTCQQGYKPNERRTECVVIPISFLTWSHGWSIVTLILTCAGIVATTSVVVIFLIYRNNQIIKASSRELSAVLLCGIMLCYLLPFFFIAMPSLWICGIRRFSVGFCFSLCYSALLVKTNRIHRIFNRKVVSLEAPPLISPLSQIFFTVLLVCIQVIIATVWLIVEKPSITFNYTDFSTELICGESTQIGLFIILGYNCLLLLITSYFAFRTRNVPQNFNETKFIFFTMITLCILWLAFIPTYIAASTTLGVIYQTGALVLAIILNAFVTLSILFVPKIYFLFSVMRKEQHEEVENLEHFSSAYANASSMETLSTHTTLSHTENLKVVPNNNRVEKVDATTQTD